MKRENPTLARIRTFRKETRPYVRQFPMTLETDNWDMLEMAAQWLEADDEVILVLKGGKKLRMSVAG